MKFYYIYRIAFILFVHCFALNINAQNPDYNLWKTNYEKGVELVEKDSFKLALPYIEKSSKIAKNIKVDSILIKSFRQLATINRINGELDKAESSIRKTLNLIENSIGKITDEYSEALLELSIIYKRKSDYIKALETTQFSSDIIKEIHGGKSLEYINSLSSISQVYVEISEYDKAISIQRNVLKYFENKDKTSNEYAYACFTMSYLNHFVNEYEDEIKYMKKAIVIYGEDHSASTTFNNNIGLAHQNLGNHEKALSYFLIALKKAKNKKNHGYAIRLQNLAFSYASLGEFEKAETKYNEALSIWNKLDKNHKDYGKLLNNVGKLYREMGELEKAKNLFKESLDNFLENFDKNHTRYGYRLNDYASILLELGQNDEALSLMKNNLQIAIENNNIDTEDFYGRQHNLAKAYNRIDSYEKALPLLESVTKNIPKILGTDHPKYGQMLKSLSNTYVGLEQIEKAIPILKKNNEIQINQLDQIFKFRSEKEKQAFLKMLSKNFDDLQSLSLNNIGNFNYLNSINLNNQLMLKGLLLNNSKNILSQLTTLDNTDIEAKVIDYKTNKRLLAKELTKPILDREINIDSLKSIINTKEAELVKLYSSNFEDNVSLIKDWKQAQTALNKKDVAIEFSHFNQTKKGEQTDGVMYVAYIYDATSEYPTMIPLFEEQQLKAILATYKSPNELYQSQELYNLIWKPIDSYIKKNATVYYSPSGLLNQLSFSAIKNKNNVLINAYNLVQLSSTNMLAHKKETQNSSNTLFVGGINYEYLVDSNEEMVVKNETYNYLKSANFSKSRGTKSRGESWTYLPGTLSEIENLKSQFEVNGNLVVTLTSNNATETNFKNLSGNSPNILHIATHGFFYENLNIQTQFDTNLSTEDQYRLANDPLLRSGLLFAGANYAWKHGSNPNEEEDGILTAMEISNLDLSNTNIVVLSACETGLGDIDGSEGVYGLQRAFKMAGVNILVMSLWQVPDTETSEFMNLFYGNWLKGQDVKLAFNNAQRSMYKKYKNEPLKWAAFVLFE